MEPPGFWRTEERRRVRRRLPACTFQVVGAAGRLCARGPGVFSEKGAGWLGAGRHHDSDGGRLGASAITGGGELYERSGVDERRGEDSGRGIGSGGGQSKVEAALHASLRAASSPDSGGPGPAGVPDPVE